VAGGWKEVCWCDAYPMMIDVIVSFLCWWAVWLVEEPGYSSIYYLMISPTQAMSYTATSKRVPS
jgi:hypothetical protein